MKPRWSWLAFAIGILVGGAGVHQLNHAMVQTAGAIARDLAVTNRALARTAERQRDLLGRIDRTALATCPEWRVATLAAEPAHTAEEQP